MRNLRAEPGLARPLGTAGVALAPRFQNVAFAAVVRVASVSWRSDCVTGASRPGALLGAIPAVALLLWISADPASENLRRVHRPAGAMWSCSRLVWDVLVYRTIPPTSSAGLDGPYGVEPGVESRAPRGARAAALRRNG